MPSTAYVYEILHMKYSSNVVCSTRNVYPVLPPAHIIVVIKKSRIEENFAFLCLLSCPYPLPPYSMPYLPLPQHAVDARPKPLVCSCSNYRVLYSVFASGIFELERIQAVQQPVTSNLSKIEATLFSRYRYAYYKLPIPTAPRLKFPEGPSWLNLRRGMWYITYYINVDIIANSISSKLVNRFELHVVDKDFVYRL